MSVSSITRRCSASSRTSALPNRLATTRSKMDMAGSGPLPVHGRHPGVQRLAMVEAATDAVGQALGVLAGGLQLDQRGGRAAFVHQLDLLHRRERRQRLLDALLGDVVRQV